MNTTATACVGANVPLLDVRSISYTYGGADAVLRDIGFTLCAGQVLSILGPNGVGKSTLLNCIAGFYRPQRGSVLVRGADIAHMGQNDVAKLIAYVPQTQTDTFAYTVRDYVVMGRAPHVGLLSTPGAKDYALVDRVLGEMGIARLAGASYQGISGGERQQVEIARVLVQGSDLVLLDEPANHLDLGNQVKVLSTIRNLVEQGRSVVLTTHNPDHALLLGGLVAVLEVDGSLTFGPVEDVLDEGLLARLYGTSIYLEHSARADRTVCFAGGEAVRGQVVPERV